MRTHPDRKTKNIALFGIMVALSMLLSYVETLIPMPIPIPGIKLGLANLVTVIVFQLIGVKEAWLIAIARILLNSLLFGNLYALAFSLAGGVLSLLFMAGAMRTGWFSVLGVSITGGVMHNIGQIAAAAVLLQAAAVLSYIPALIIGGVISGALIGLAAFLILNRIKKTGVDQHE